MLLAPGDAHLEELVVDLLDDDIHAGQRAGRGDARAHEAAAQHRDLLHLPGLQASVCDTLHLHRASYAWTLCTGVHAQPIQSYLFIAQASKHPQRCLWQPEEGQKAWSWPACGAFCNSLRSSALEFIHKCHFAITRAMTPDAHVLLMRVT